MIKSFYEYTKMISEGLITTYDIDKTIYGITNMLTNHNIQCKSYKNPNNTFSIEILNFNIIDSSLVESLLDMLTNSTINLYGWFPSRMSMLNWLNDANEKKYNSSELIMISKKLLSVKITFESKFDLVVDIPSKLYHLSIQQYRESVVKNGLFPISKSKLTSHDYDGRIYVTKSLHNCESLIDQMKFHYGSEKMDIIYDKNNKKRSYTKNTKWIIYEIDSDLSNITKMYTDPNYLGGFYVLNNIPPNAIAIIVEE